MSTAITTTKIAHTTALCAGLAIANLAWSNDCPEAVGTTTATDPDASQAQALSAADLYELLHDQGLNQLDGLGDYVHNFHPDRPIASALSE